MTPDSPATVAVLDLADIDIGERDRTDLGDITELAASIDEVGLLHPVVVTRDRKLVAGGRRLAAVRELGWLEVPVTYVSVDKVADVLRAEMDENTCRKPLTPYEASRARERRAAVLAPEAAERERAGIRQPSSKLDEGSPSARSTRKAAATGTGYSGSTLDKVDRIRNAAEHGIVKRGREELPVPEPVREIARKALEGVKQTGAAVDSADRKVGEALNRYMDSAPAVRRLRRSKEWRAAFTRATALYSWDVEEVATLMDHDEWLEIELAAQQTQRWYAALLAQRPGKGLRVVGGSR